MQLDLSARLLRQAAVGGKAAALFLSSKGRVMARNRSNVANKDASRRSLVSSPRLVSDEKGRTVEVILGYEDYRARPWLKAAIAPPDALHGPASSSR